MKTFKDSAGRDWLIVINYSAKERVQAMTGLDLFDLSVFERIGDDPAKLIDVLYAVCKPDADKIPITKAQFVDSLVGDVIEQAAEALTQEIIDFFPKRRREMLNKVLATARQVQDKAMEMIDAKLSSGEILKKLEQSLSEPSGSLPEPSGSTPAPSPSGNSA